MKEIPRRKLLLFAGGKVDSTIDRNHVPGKFRKKGNVIWVICLEIN